MNKYLILVILQLFLVLETFADEIESDYVAGNTIKVSGIVISLEMTIEDILILLDSDYDIEPTPKYKSYYINEQPLVFWVDYKTNYISSITYYFYRKDQKSITNDFKIDDYFFEYNLSFQNLKAYLNSKKLDFTIKESSKTIRFKIKNSRIRSIMYFKNDKNRPYKIEFGLTE